MEPRYQKPPADIVPLRHDKEYDLIHDPFCWQSASEARAAASGIRLEALPAAQHFISEAERQKMATLQQNQADQAALLNASPVERATARQQLVESELRVGIAQAGRAFLELELSSAESYVRNLHSQAGRLIVARTCDFPQSA